MPDPSLNKDDFARALLGWYHRQGRDLPWRKTRDPYRIWVSEIMLQQTTVTTVLGRYAAFLEQFPRLADLARAPLEQVIDAWAGLGYYSRARNLHAAAVRIMTDHAGIFPADPAILQRLPGIGRSTAGAIVALANDRPAPILDANVRRVLCRVFALLDPPRSTAAEKQLWRWSEQLTPDRQVHDYTQGMMDLGAMICLPRDPRCGECPVKVFCLACERRLQQDLPVRTPKKTVPTRYQVAVVMKRQDRFLVRRRSVDGFLGGLWEFPSLDLQQVTEGEAALRGFLLQQVLSGDLSFKGIIQHLYSHFKLEALVWQVTLADTIPVAESAAEWKTQGELNALALHGAHKKILSLPEFRSGQLTSTKDQQQ